MPTFFVTDENLSDIEEELRREEETRIMRLKDIMGKTKKTI